MTFLRCGKSKSIFISVHMLIYMLHGTHIMIRKLPSSYQIQSKAEILPDRMKNLTIHIAWDTLYDITN